MIEAAKDFDAWGSALISAVVGGFIAAVGVVWGVRWGQAKADTARAADVVRADELRRQDLEAAAKLRSEDLQALEARRRQDADEQLSRDRRAAADQLIVEVSNLRDLATRSKHGHDGSYLLFALRNELFRAAFLLDEFPSYFQTWQFHEAVRHFRDWTSDRRKEQNAPALGGRDKELADGHAQKLDEYGGRIIEQLQHNLVDKSLPERAWEDEGLPKLS